MSRRSSQCHRQPCGHLLRETRSAQAARRPLRREPGHQRMRQVPGVGRQSLAQPDDATGASRLLGLQNRRKHRPQARYRSRDDQKVCALQGVRQIGSGRQRRRQVDARQVTLIAPPAVNVDHDRRITRPQRHRMPPARVTCERGAPGTRPQYGDLHVDKTRQAPIVPRPGPTADNPPAPLHTGP